MTTDFASLPLSQASRDVVAELGYTTPTEIQAKCIPLLLEGKDVIGQSKTGSGKTLAFGLPLLEGVQGAERALTSLVLCPTRELCDQVARELRKLGRRIPGLTVLVLAGGQPIAPQRSALSRGAHLAVATPGRLIDLLDRGDVDLASVTKVVLDEADRMLEMGFKEDMVKILRAVPRTRQTALFSATFPEAIEGMSRAYQRDPVHVTVSSELTPTEIEQTAYELGDTDRLDALVQVLALHRHESALVFCNLKATVDAVRERLAQEGLSVERIHGDLEQRDRDRVMAKLRNKSVRVLVATDVASRGIDVPALDLVVSFDVPTDLDAYVHRIGRTGRAGKRGLALSLVKGREQERLSRIEAATGVTIARKTLPATTPRKAAPAASAEMVTLYISGGRKEKVRPGDVLGALTGEAGGFSGSDVGKIEIHDHFTYVAVSRGIAKRAVDALSAGKIKGRKFKVGFVD